ncbi:cytochrome P450 [Nocardiopsis sp. CNT-189]|uniref:cytochrome P450 n=1 Tax=Nocardiopsis oceanisediminis TaxID=2816862 RepID=UPI003B37AD35
MTAETGRELRFPLSSAVPSEPAPELAEMRGGCPVAPVRLPSGDRAWLVTRYADNLALFSDERFSRAAAARSGSPRARNIPLDPHSITTMDPPEHTRLRRVLGGAFSPRRLDRLAGRIGSASGALLDAIGRGASADLVADLAQPLALGTICDLLGLPEEERGRFREWTEDYLGLGRDRADAAAEAARRLDSHFAGLVEERIGAPSDDVFGALVQAHTEGRLSAAELRSFATTLLVAGYETVAAQIAGSMVVLLSRPGDRSGLLDGDRLRGPVVEELLRYVPLAMTGGTIRVAVADTELGGRLIRAGEAVLPSTVSANRDPEAFADPDVFDPDRRDGRHIAFGHGPHRCLGAHLARLQLSIAVGGLLRRFPGIRPAEPLDSLEWNTAKPIRCPVRLPVTW